MFDPAVLYDGLSQFFHTHARVLDGSGGLLRLHTVRRELFDSFALSNDIFPKLCMGVQRPSLYTINDLLTYMIVPIPERYLALGPMGLCADCIKKLSFPDLIIPEGLIPELYAVSSSQLIHTGVFLYRLFSGPLDLLAAYQENCSGTDEPEDPLRKATQSLFYHEEYGRSHISYEAERREMGCIERGDTTLLQECWKEESGNVGVLSQDLIRNARYLCIVNITLSARAAIRGGVPCEMAYALGDAYCQQIDSLEEKNFYQMEGIVRNIQLTFARMVSEQNIGNTDASSDKPHLVARAKNYIFSHLHGKLTVQDVATEMNTHPNYLNRLFKQSEGITIHDYILREKIRMACNMLTYSDHSYIDIVYYLGFSSQSHLGNHFKKYTGMTMKQYRDTYHKGG